MTASFSSQPLFDSATIQQKCDSPPLNDRDIRRRFHQFKKQLKNEIGPELYRKISSQLSLSIFPDFAELMRKGEHIPPLSFMLYRWRDINPHTPSNISWICCVSATLYLVAGILAFHCNLLRHKIAGVVLIMLFLSSILHWREPWYSGWRRTFDLIMVSVSVIYASYCAALLPLHIGSIWFIGLFVGFIIWYVNDMLTLNKVKSPKLMAESEPDKVVLQTIKAHLNSARIKSQQSLMDRIYDAFSLTPTWPNTHEREQAFYLGAILHSTGLHLFTGTAGIIMATLTIQHGL